VKTPPLFSEHSRPVQFLLAVVIPTAFGALVGYMLGISEPVYIVLSLLGVLGGIGAGFDHVGAKAGALRGVLGGLLFGAAILIAHEIDGSAPEAHLPEPAIILVVVTTLLGAAFGAVGGWLRSRSLAKAPSEVPGAERGAAEGVEEPVVAAPAVVEPRHGPGPDRPAPANATASTTMSAAAPTAGAASGTVSLNSAGFEDFRSLGLTITQARRLIDHRERLGGYSSLDQLDQVPGLSKSLLANLKRRLEL